MEDQTLAELKNTMNELVELSKQSYSDKTKAELYLIKEKLFASNMVAFNNDPEIKRKLNYLSPSLFYARNGDAGNEDRDNGFREKINKYEKAAIKMYMLREAQLKLMPQKEGKQEQKVAERQVQTTKVIESDREKTARDFTSSSDKLIAGAKQDKVKGEWADCVRKSVESMEMSLKAFLVDTIGEFPRSHNFQDTTSKELYRRAKNKIEKELKKDISLLSRLFFVPHFWSYSYEYTKYGGDYGTPKEVYTAEEAELALKHAKEIRGSIFFLALIKESPTNTAVQRQQ